MNSLFPVLTRRRLLEMGGISLLGLGLPEFLRAGAPGQRQRQTERSCIFIVQYGGPSHIDTLDLKPDAPAEIRGPYKPIATSVPGIRICDLLPRLAQQAENFSLIRSMSHRNTVHDGAMSVCFTGHSKPAENAPYFGSVLAKLRPTPSNLPSYVWLQNLDKDIQTRYLTGGFLGSAYAPLIVGKNQDNVAAPGFRMKAFDPPAEVSPERVRERHRLLKDLEESQDALPLPVQAMQRFQDRAVDIVTGPEARKAFDLENEPRRLRERYGLHTFGQNLLLARRLIESGVRLVAVNAWMGVPPGDRFRVVQGWDMHGVAIQECGIFSTGHFGLGYALPRFDQALSALLEDMNLRGLLENTLVVVTGEFGRSPKITRLPYEGRDHWPQCYSALLAGAGIRGGMVHGASDKIGAYVRDNPVAPEDFGATLYHVLGVPPETRLSPDGATLPASTGQPIEDILS